MYITALHDYADLASRATQILSNISAYGVGKKLESSFHFIEYKHKGLPGMSLSLITPQHYI